MRTNCTRNGEEEREKGPGSLKHWYEIPEGTVTSCHKLNGLKQLEHIVS